MQYDIIVGHSFLEQTRTRRIVLWEHMHVDGQDEPAKGVAEIVEFDDRHDGHYVRQVMRALTTGKYFDGNVAAFNKAWRERMKHRS